MKIVYSATPENKPEFLTADPDLIKVLFRLSRQDKNWCRSSSSANGNQVQCQECPFYRRNNPASENLCMTHTHSSSEPDNEGFMHHLHGPSLAREWIRRYGLTEPE